MMFQRLQRVRVDPKIASGGKILLDKSHIEHEAHSHDLSLPVQGNRLDELRSSRSLWQQEGPSSLTTKSTQSYALEIYVYREVFQVNIEGDICDTVFVSRHCYCHTIPVGTNRCFKLAILRMRQIKIISNGL